MYTHEPITPSFDVLSYPRSAAVEGLVLDISGEIDRTAVDNISYLGDRAVCGAERDTSAQYESSIAEFGHGPDRLMLVSENPDTAENALQSGMGVILVENAQGAAAALDLMIDPASQT
ncbi:MAG: hypothetical protein ABWX94_02425, partial [Candidatus Saccharimonadales bacterium]